MEKRDEENNLKNLHIRELTPDDDGWPPLLDEIFDPPKRLFIQGSWPPQFADGTTINEKTKFLCVVGARRHSVYGREVCQALIAGLAGYNICIVSGLALGLDAVAHEAALAARIPTIAFPGSGLDREVLYPPRNQRLADRILISGGALISEYDMDTAAAPWCFPQRNRLMAGVSHAVLVIEAKCPSGTLITAKLAESSNRDIYAVPGDIFSSLSEGPHMLINKGAAIITSSADILHQLGIKLRDENGETDSTHSPPQNSLFENRNDKTVEEKTLQKIIVDAGNKIHRDDLISIYTSDSSSSVADTLATLSLMEMDGIIREQNGIIHLVKNRI